MACEQSHAFAGYVQHPSIHGDKVAFIAENDVWISDINDGRPQRMTNGMSARWPLFSLDGSSWPVAWADSYVIIASSWHDPFDRPSLFRVPYQGGQPDQLYHGECDAYVTICGGEGVCIGRQTTDPIKNSRWKGYRGGQHGSIWLALDGPKAPLKQLHIEDPHNPGAALNIASIMWRGDRLWFVADPDGSSNLWSVNLEGQDLQKHTCHSLFDVRNAKAGDTGVVYTHAGELWILPSDGVEARRVNLDFGSPCSHLPLVLSAEDWIEDVAMHPMGHVCSVLCRGQVFEMALWEGPAVPLLPSTALCSDDAVDSGSRCVRSTRCHAMEYLSSGCLITVTDEQRPLTTFTIHPPACMPSGDIEKPTKTREWLAVLIADLGMATQRLILEKSIGQIIGMVASPVHDAVLLSTVRNELWLLEFVVEGGDRPNPQMDPIVKLDTCLHLETRLLDRSEYFEGISDPSWSPDGEWVAYSRRDTKDGRSLLLLHLASDSKTVIADSSFDNGGLSFDPNGSFLAFFSARVFAPLEDGVTGEMKFSSCSQLPYLFLLQKDTINPFHRKALSPAQIEAQKDGDDDDGDDDDGDEDAEDDDEEDGEEKYQPPKQIEIDVEGLADRIVQFPVEPGKYAFGAWTADGKFQYARAVEKVKPPSSDEDENETGALYAYDFKRLKEEQLAECVASVVISKDLENMLVCIQEDDEEEDYKYYAVAAGKKLTTEGEDDDEEDLENPGPDSGLLDIDSRISLQVVPAEEWSQIFEEICHHVKEFFFDETFGGVDWEDTCKRYLEVLPRLRSRSELTDLCEELLSELGVSHISLSAPSDESYDGSEGHLGATVSWLDLEGGGGVYKVESVLKGDVWDPKSSGPLARAGVGIKYGDYIVAINRMKVCKEVSLDQMVSHCFPGEVFLTYVSAEDVQSYTNLLRGIAQVGAADGLRRMTTQHLQAMQGQNARGKKKKAKKGVKKKKQDPVVEQRRHVEKKMTELLKNINIDASEGPIWRTVRVSVAGSEVRRSARLRDLVEKRSLRTHTVSDGRVGYIYVPDCCELGFSEFYRRFARECQRNALIVDARCNQGGFTAEFFLNHLRNQPMCWDIPRSGHGKPSLSPDLCTKGNLILMIDENTCSDGECWAAAFQNQGLGKVVGVRSWGGVVCVGDADIELVDGAELSLPSDHCYMIGKSGYSLENCGAQPDIVVEFPPDVQCDDPQLEEAIKQALNMLEAATPWPPELPAFPRTRLHRKAREDTVTAKG